MPSAEAGENILNTDRGRRELKNFLENFQNTLEGVCYDVERDLLKILLKAEKYTEKDIQWVVEKLHTNKKIIVLLYSFPIHFWHHLPKDIMQSLYHSLDEKKQKLEKLGKTLDNLDAPRFAVLDQLIKETQ